MDGWMDGRPGLRSFETMGMAQHDSCKDEQHDSCRALAGGPELPVTMPCRTQGQGGPLAATTP